MKNRIIYICIAVIFTVIIAVGIYFLITSVNLNVDDKNVEDNNIYEEEKNSDEVIEENKELFSDYYDQAQKIIHNMSLEEKVGQLFLARCPEKGEMEEIKSLNPAGYILFARDFKDKTKEKVIENIKNYQSVSKIPMLIAIDEEGGKVVRASGYKAFRNEKFASPQELYKNGGFELIRNDTIDKARFLKELGVNVNLAPVSDISTSESDYIYSRTFGKNAEETSKYVSIVIQAMNEENIGSSLKHFPGYGGNVDTHTGIAHDKRTLEEFRQSDFLPFIAGIKNNAPSVLVSHNVVESMDKDYPASISENVHKILREELNFSGVIMTDDMAMSGVKEFKLEFDPAVYAINAGNDLVITSDIAKQKQAVIQAINDGVIDIKKVDMAVKRVLAWKFSMKLM